jgi:hypothetical protein
LIAAHQTAAEYRGFGFGRKAEIALLDRRKRLKNHDVVFKRREPFEPPRRPPGPDGRASRCQRRRRRSRERKSLFSQRLCRELSNANVLTVAFRAFLSGHDLWLRDRRRRKPNALQTEL